MKLSKEIDFFVYLIERYAASKGKTGADMLRLFDESGITDFIIDMYELYHAERLENAFSDIDDLIEHGIPA
jgi:hypothetical protein